jgi:hypothetical protein
MADNASQARRRSARSQGGDIAPACSNPAPLARSRDRAPGHLITYVEPVDAKQTTAALAAKYGFSPQKIWDPPVPGFLAILDTRTVAGLRCEPSIKFIEENAYAHLAP